MILELLFERLWLLLALLVAIQFGLIAMWSWRRSRFWTRGVWAGFAAIPLLLLLSNLVVTPQEQIIRLCHDLAKLVEEGDVVAIGRHLADDFLVVGLDRSDFLDRIEKNLTTYQVDDPRLRGFKVEFSRKDKGVAVFDAVCQVRSPDVDLNRLLSRWRLTFRNHGAGWQVTTIEVVRTPLSPIRDIRDCLR